MVILMHIFPEADNPYHALFWGVMSLATMTGMITAYPINSWMVAKGLKHGMMSIIAEPTMSVKMDMSKKESMQTHLSLFQTIFIVIITFAILFVSLFLTNIFAPIVF